MNIDFTNAKVLVVGDVMLDRYWHGDTDRISPEAPVPVLHVRHMEERPGGAANVALNVQALGGKVVLLGLVGQDELALSLEQKLQALGINHNLLRIAGVPTISKLRIIGRNQQLIRLDLEEHFVDYSREELIKSYTEQLKQANMVILSDYGKGTLRFSKELIALARAHQVPILVDPKSKDFEMYRGVTVITPNLSEFEAVVGPCCDEATLEEQALALIAQYDIAAILVTRGAKGMSLIRADAKPLHLAAHAREVYDVTGAGDTVIATLATALTTGCDIAQAATLANTAAGIVVKKLGAATVSLAELASACQQSATLDTKQLLQQIAVARSRGERIVMTNGVFDILHAGHVAYLAQAKALGDRLLVAVNDDASVTRLKGIERPINKLPERMAVLAALRAVDWVVSFTEDTPELLIAKVKPDVLVKGGDYKVAEIAGADLVLNNAGEVIIVPLEPGFSTTTTIQRIRGD